MDAVLYEKCAHCWHFIDLNDVDSNEYYIVSEYVHLDNGEKEHDHDAAPSGDVRTLDTWKRDHPELFHTHKDGMIGPNSVHFIPEFATAWECADNCDTCWWLLSVGPESAEAELGEDLARAKLRIHIASGHMLTSEEIVPCSRCGWYIRHAEGVWLDDTDGQGCTDDMGVEGVHQP